MSGNNPPILRVKNNRRRDHPGTPRPSGFGANQRLRGSQNLVSWAPNSNTWPEKKKGGPFEYPRKIAYFS